MTKWPLKTVTHYAEQPGDLAIHRIGNLWTVGIVTKSGTVEIEMSIEAACSLREFFVDAVCPNPTPTTARLAARVLAHIDTLPLPKETP